MMAWLLVYIADVPRGILIPDQVLARTDPGTEDLIVALAAGVAGAYVQINKSELSLLPGAAIGVSLVPPLSASGILLYFDEPAEAYEAGLLFATNLGAIILSACAVYLVYAARSVVFSKGKRKLNFTASVFVAIAFLVVVVLQLGKSPITVIWRRGPRHNWPMPFANGPIRFPWKSSASTSTLSANGPRFG